VPLTPEVAAPTDVRALKALRDAAARWQAARGIDQWRVGEVDVLRLEAEVVRGEWYVVRRELGGVSSIAVG